MLHVHLSTLPQPPTSQIHEPSAAPLLRVILTPQPVEVFGLSTWNALPLAENTNFVENEMMGMCVVHTGIGSPAI